MNCFFFFNDTATTEIYTLSLHDALPISAADGHRGASRRAARGEAEPSLSGQRGLLLARQPRILPLRLWHVGKDRKSTRLNSSHANISYAVFCLKKKKIHTTRHSTQESIA